MASYAIGQLAALCGLNPSAIRYYEKAGLMPRAVRVNRQRRYGSEAIGQLRLLLIARHAGFSVAETRTFVTGFDLQTPPAERWKSLARRKLADIDSQIARLEQMKGLLNSSFKCSCPSIEHCAVALSEHSSNRSAKPRGC